MQFSVLPPGRWPPSSPKLSAFLVSDNWDDSGRFSTVYCLHVVDAEGKPRRVGQVKIGQFGMAEGQRSPRLPAQFVEAGT